MGSLTSPGVKLRFRPDTGRSVDRDPRLFDEVISYQSPVSPYGIKAPMECCDIHGQLFHYYNKVLGGVDDVMR